MKRKKTYGLESLGPGISGRSLLLSLRSGLAAGNIRIIWSILIRHVCGGEDVEDLRRGPGFFVLETTYSADGE
jgi:hypothetical protein